MKKKRTRLFHKGWIAGFAFFLFLTNSNMIVSAVSVELFSSTQVENNSGTTAAAPYMNVSNKPVTFNINGTTAIGAMVGRTGVKYAFVNVPAQLTGSVQKNGDATVDTTVTVLASDIKAVTGPILDSVTSLTRFLTILGLGTTVTNLNNAITALNNEDFGRQVFTSPIEQYSSTLLRADINQGLLPVITNALVLRLQAIQTIIRRITPVPLINIRVNNLLTTLTNTIRTLNNANSTLSQNLVAASILGTTEASFPTLVSSPAGLTQDYTATIRGGIFQTDNFDVQLLSNYGGVTTIYFAAGVLAMKEELLPSSLNFGSHLVQTKLDETWNAHVEGNSANPLQTGTIRIDDTRTTAKAWQLKLAQTNAWANGQKNLDNARLDILLGGVTSNFQNYTATTNQTIQMVPSNQVTLFSLSSTTDAGYFELPLNQFQLFVPKNIPKQTGTYQTTLQWTISDTP